MSKPSTPGLRSEALLSPLQAAEFVGMSKDTFMRFVRNGEVRFINAGHGQERIKRLFDRVDLQEFLGRRKEIEACLSINQKAPKRSSTIFGGEVIGFRARQALSPSGRLSK